MPSEDNIEIWLNLASRLDGKVLQLLIDLISENGKLNIATWYLEKGEYVFSDWFQAFKNEETPELITDES